VSSEHQSLDQQADALAAAGVHGTRVYSDKLSGTSTRQQRPGLAALLDYAREATQSWSSESTAWAETPPRW
jgi:DNA invertase Pin-like site-specific DNA recombinase